MITLAPYGFYWFQLQERDKSEPVTPRAVPEFETLVVPLEFDLDVAGARARRVRARRAAGPSWRATRWYPGANPPRQIQPTLTSAMPFCDIGDNRPWLAFFETDAARHHRRATCCRCRSNGCASTASATTRRRFAAVRQGAREGTLLDVATDQIFIGLFLRNLRQNLAVEEGEQGLRLEFRPTSRFADTAGQGSPNASARSRTISRTAPRWSTTNTSPRSTASSKAGINPEIEIGRYLTEVAELCQYAGAARQRRAGRGRQAQRDRACCMPMVVRTRATAGRSPRPISTAMSTSSACSRRAKHAAETAASRHPICTIMSQTGQRLAELHVALASNRDLPDFAPEPTRPDDLQRWIDEIKARAERVFERAGAAPRRPAGGRPAAGRSAAGAAHDMLPERLKALLPRETDGFNIRHHGDFHLGQLLIVKDDIFIIDFDGEPRRTHRRAAPQGAGRARRRRPDPLDRLLRRPRRSNARSRSRPTSSGRLSDCARPNGASAPAATFLAAYRETMAGQRLWPADRQAGGAPARTSSCLRKPSTKSSTSWPTGRSGSACR